MPVSLHYIALFLCTDTIILYYSPSVLLAAIWYYSLVATEPGRFVALSLLNITDQDRQAVVILSAAKNLALGTEILRCAQNDSETGPFKRPFCERRTG